MKIKLSDIPQSIVDRFNKVEELENQLKEKDAMIDWLANKLANFCNLGEVCPSDQSNISCPNPQSLCHIESNDWRKAAQDAIKKR